MVERDVYKTAGRISAAEAEELITGYENERWYADGTRVMRDADGDEGEEEIVDVAGLRDPECDAGVAKIMAAAPRALLTLDALHAECVAWRERAEAMQAKIARYVTALDERAAAQEATTVRHGSTPPSADWLFAAFDSIASPSAQQRDALEWHRSASVAHAAALAALRAESATVRAAAVQEFIHDEATR